MIRTGSVQVEKSNLPRLVHLSQELDNLIMIERKPVTIEEAIPALQAEIARETAVYIDSARIDQNHSDSLRDFITFSLSEANSFT